jgi:hypothetical protein
MLSSKIEFPDSFGSESKALFYHSGSGPRHTKPKIQKSSNLASVRFYAGESGVKTIQLF